MGWQLVSKILLINQKKAIKNNPVTTFKKFIKSCDLRKKM